MIFFSNLNYHIKSPRWITGGGKVLRNGGAALLIMSAAVAGLTGCSDNDDEWKGSPVSPTYHALDADNLSMPSSGTLWTQYSDAPAGCMVGNLVDNDPETRYVTYHDNVKITWNGSTRVPVRSYSLTSAADAPEADPGSWTLSGSSDNYTWTVLDSQNDVTFAGRGETKTFDLSNDNEYKYYRLTILGNHGAGFTHLAEFAMTASAFAGDIDDLINDPDKCMGSTYHPDNVMGKQHQEADGPVTPEKLQWLRNPGNEPETFAGLGWTTFQVANLFPFGDPVPADVNQRGIGDCCLCAAMASLAYVYPAFIKDIITDNGNGTFTVKLYDPKGNQIEVGVSSYFAGGTNDLSACSGKNGQPVWSTVLEKSIIKWFQAFRGHSDIGGIGTEYAMSIITGNGTSWGFGAGKLTADELKRAVNVSLKRGQLVVGGFSQGDIPVSGTFKTITGHAFTMSLPDDDDTMFIMRNPWGNEAVDGRYWIKDDNVVPGLIDLRIMEPGAAAPYGVGVLLAPYTPPSF